LELYLFVFVRIPANVYYVYYVFIITTVSLPAEKTGFEVSLQHLPFNQITPKPVIFFLRKKKKENI